jgi:hypothetical protein
MLAQQFVGVIIKRQSMLPFENLAHEELELLYQAPVLLSVQVSCSENGVDKNQKADAIRLAHLKSFTANPKLLSYYSKVDKVFKERFETALQKYCPLNADNQQQLRKEMDKINAVINKLDPSYQFLLRKSLDKYATHVRKANHSVVQDFIIPIPIPGLTDY